MIEDLVKSMTISDLVTTDQFEDAIKEVFPFDDKTLDRMFDSEADKFQKVFTTAALELYEGRTAAFTTEIMRKVERDIYLQVLDNLWMQHLENMDHLREGIHWMSVGQQDPLVEYRRRGQVLFDGMQALLSHDVLMHLFHAQPISEAEMQRAAETDLTRAAASSVDNASQISSSEREYDEGDFKTRPENQPVKTKTSERKKARKVERKRKTAAKRRKK
jgi:preprotein translocase subunit SecA